MVNPEPSLHCRHAGCDARAVRDADGSLAWMITFATPDHDHEPHTERAQS